MDLVALTQRHIKGTSRVGKGKTSLLPKNEQLQVNAKARSHHFYVLLGQTVK